MAAQLPTLEHDDAVVTLTLAIDGKRGAPAAVYATAEALLPALLSLRGATAEIPLTVRAGVGSSSDNRSADATQHLGSAVMRLAGLPLLRRLAGVPEPEPVAEASASNVGSASGGGKLTVRLSGASLLPEAASRVPPGGALVVEVDLPGDDPLLRSGPAPFGDGVAQISWEHGYACHHGSNLHTAVAEAIRSPARRGLGYGTLMRWCSMRVD